MTESEDSAEQTLRIERTFAAPIQAVFDAWTSVDVLRRWWPAGRDWQTVVAEADVRVDGALRLQIRTPSGETYGGEGRYTELRPPVRLAFTWRWADPAGRPTQLVEITLTDNADGTTTVVLVNSGITGDDLSEHGRGWALSLDNLDRLLRHHPTSRREGAPG
jgi:uncharacterized protein YndB with AHSA1/START domain